MDVTGISQLVVATVTTVGLRVVGALILWIIGRALINMAVRLVSRALTIRHIDATITRPTATTLRATFLPGPVGLQYRQLAWQTQSAAPGVACGSASASRGRAKRSGTRA